MSGGLPRGLLGSIGSLTLLPLLCLGSTRFDPPDNLGSRPCLQVGRIEPLAGLNTRVGDLAGVRMSWKKDQNRDTFYHLHLIFP